MVEQRRRTNLFENNPYIPTRAAALSSHTLHGHVRALRAFATWLYGAGYTDANVLADVKPPRTHKAVMDTLADEEVQKLLQAIDRTTAIGLRDYALVVTYLDTGARCNELLTLRCKDAHLDEGWLPLDGKGNKERMVRIGATAKAALRTWLKQGRPAMASDPCPLLFVDGRTGGQVTVSAVERRIRNVASGALPGRRVYCHLFRHTFATNFLVYGLGDELPTPSILARVFAGGAVRARATAHAILRLTTGKPPFGAEALQLARSIWELLLSLEYIASGDEVQREERAIRYLSHSIATRDRVVHALELMIEDEQFKRNEAFVHRSLKDHLMRQGRSESDAAAEAQRRLDTWRGKPFWSGMGTRELINHIRRPGVNRQKEYAWVYPFLSQYAHVTSASILPSASHDSSLAAYDETTGRLAAQWAVEWVVVFYLLVSDIFELGWDERLINLRDAVKDQWSQHQSSSAGP